MEITQEMLDHIKQAGKQMTPAPKRVQRGSQQWNFDIRYDEDLLRHFDEEEKIVMLFYARQSVSDPVNFSCGIVMRVAGKKITLSRYNGANHVHGSVRRECHIHNATVASINRGDRKPEGEDTQATDRYRDLNGAAKCLVQDYRISVPGDTNLLGDWLA